MINVASVTKFHLYKLVAIGGNQDQQTPWVNFALRTQNPKRRLNIGYNVEEKRFRNDNCIAYLQKLPDADLIKATIISLATGEPIVYEPKPVVKNGRKLPYGYRLECGLLVEDETEQAALSLMRKLSALGETVPSICLNLEAKGHLRRDGSTYWDWRTVRHLISRAMPKSVIHTLKRGPIIPEPKPEHILSLIPYGYRLSCGRLVEDKEEQEAIGLMRKLRESGHLLDDVCRTLETKGYHRRNGERWTNNVVSHILSRKPPKFINCENVMLVGEYWRLKAGASS